MDTKGQIMAILDKECQSWRKDREADEAAGFDLSVTYGVGGISALIRAMSVIDARIPSNPDKMVKLADVLAILGKRAEALTKWQKKDEENGLAHNDLNWLDCAASLNLAIDDIKCSFA